MKNTDSLALQGTKTGAAIRLRSMVRGPVSFQERLFRSEQAGEKLLKIGHDFPNKHSHHSKALNIVYRAEHDMLHAYGAHSLSRKEQECCDQATD
jgi:hypothetical protein